LECGFLKQLTFIEKMLKTVLWFLVTITLLFSIQVNAQPGIKVGISTSALQSSREVIRPFLGYDVSWLQDGTSNPAFELQLGIFYTIKISNAFNPTTTIEYQIPDLSFVSLKVYDALRNEIITLVDEEKPAGNYKVEFNGKDLTSGFYFYKLLTGRFVETKKMILLK
jgi:hypothetical protein